MSCKKTWGRVFVCMMLLVSMSLSGCANVREKFVRKKKKEKQDAFVPVLTPEAYTNASNDPLKAYQQHYTLWRTWYNEINVAFDYDESQKRKLHLMREAAKQLQAMAALLPESERQGMDDLIWRMNDLIAYVDRPSVMWERLVVERKLRLIEKDVRNQFKPDVVGNLTLTHE